MVPSKKIQYLLPKPVDVVAVLNPVPNPGVENGFANKLVPVPGWAPKLKPVVDVAVLVPNVGGLLANNPPWKYVQDDDDDLGQVVQSVVSLTSSLRVISLTVLADSIYNILIFFAEKMWVAFALQKLLTFFQQKISEYLRITRCKF